MTPLRTVTFWLSSLCLCLCLVSCGRKANRNVEFFKDTKAYSLAKAVQKGDLKTIERLVKQDPTLLELSNPVSGSNVLVLCLYVEKFEPFKKLLELGANPNFINHYTKYSVLINSCKPFGSAFEWIKDNRYAEILLQYGADHNYAVEEEFTNEKKHHIRATSPLMEASSLNLDLVKMLIKSGADYNKKLGSSNRTPFSESAISCKYDIIYYYIDTLGVDVNQPMSTVVQKPANKEVTFYIQDYIMTNLMYRKLRNSKVDIEIDRERWELIQYLETKGVDFKNYNYRVNWGQRCAEEDARAAK